MNSPTVGQLKSTFNTTLTPLRWRNKAVPNIRPNPAIATPRDLKIISGNGNEDVPDYGAITVGWLRKILNITSVPLLYNGAIPSIKLNGTVSTSQFIQLASEYSGGGEEDEIADGPLVNMHITYVWDASDPIIEAVFEPDTVEGQLYFRVLYTTSSTLKYTAVNCTEFSKDTELYYSEHGKAIANDRSCSWLSIRIPSDANDDDWIDIYTVGSLWTGEYIVQTFANRVRLTNKQIKDATQGLVANDFTLESVYNTHEYDYVNFFIPPQLNWAMYSSGDDMLYAGSIVVPCAGIFEPLTANNSSIHYSTQDIIYPSNQSLVPAASVETRSGVAEILARDYTQYSNVAYIEYTNREGNVVPAETLMTICNPESYWSNGYVNMFVGNGIGTGDMPQLMNAGTNIYIRHYRTSFGIATYWTDVYKLNGKNRIYKKPYRTLQQTATAGDESTIISENNEDVIPSRLYCVDQSLNSSSLSSKVRLSYANYNAYADNYIEDTETDNAFEAYCVYYNLFGRYGFDRYQLIASGYSPSLRELVPIERWARMTQGIIGRTKEDDYISIIGIDERVGGDLSLYYTTQTFYPPSIGIPYNIKYYAIDTTKAIERLGLRLNYALESTPNITIKGVLAETDVVINNTLTYVPASELTIDSNKNNIYPPSTGDIFFLPYALHYVHEDEEYLISCLTTDDGSAYAYKDAHGTPFLVWTNLFSLTCWIWSETEKAIGERYTMISTQLCINQNAVSEYDSDIAYNKLYMPWFMDHYVVYGEYSDGSLYEARDYHIWAASSSSHVKLVAIHVANQQVVGGTYPNVKAPFTLRFAVDESRLTDANDAAGYITFYLSKPKIDFDHYNEAIIYGNDELDVT